MELTLTAKGQVTFNKGLMAYLGVQPGDKISIVRAPDGHLDIAAAQRKTTTKEMFAQLRALNEAYDGEKIHLTLDDIKRGIEEGYAERAMRGLK